MRNQPSLPYLSVIIPCYNEAQNLARGVLQQVYDYLSRQRYSWEVIIVNDESTDDSRQRIEGFIAHKPAFSLLDIPHGGKPAAVWAGIKAAKGEIVLFTDMDQSTALSEADKLLPWYDEGYDVVIGSRGIERDGFSFYRQAGSVVFRSLRRLFLLRNISDTQCGFKSSRRSLALEVFPRLQYFQQADHPAGWKVSAFDVELLYLFEKTGVQIKEVEVLWCNRDESCTKGGQGELKRYFNESVEMVKEVLRVKMNQIKGVYDSAAAQQK
jgi:glycosyltransferase involved in cell wall biosynthesis